jgi:beta-lactamase class D
VIASAVVLFGPAADGLLVHKPERAQRRFPPASTPKILDCLIALETGALADEHQIIPRDGVDPGEWRNGDRAIPVGYTGPGITAAR